MNRSKTGGATMSFPKAFAERSKVTIAVIGLLTMTVLFLVTFNADAMPVIGGGAKYQAQFAESGGLRSGNEVRVAGVKVGKVTDVSLKRDVVVVTFRAKGIEMKDQTSAAIKVKTALGQKYLSLAPAGTGTLDGPIPIARTTTPYDVNAAFSDLSTNLGEIDQAQVEKSLAVLSETFKDTPDSVRTSVKGLTDLSRTISTRDEKLAGLLKATREVSGTLKDRNAEFAALINDGSALLGELESRRRAVHALLEGTARLGTQVEGLVADNTKQLKPALDQLDKVARILQDNQGHLEDAIKRVGPYYRVLASATGNGRWLDTYVCGLYDDQAAPLLDSDATRNCSPKKGGGR